ncbi:adenylate kinase [Myxococcota bacterium]|nr:adenylate kinase [Myxococcota bacterium]
MTAKRLLLLGAPGSGKGTQAATLVKNLGIDHISTGDMLRSAVAEGTELGKQAKSLMDQGQLVPDDLVIGVASDRLARNGIDRGFVLDGFPRTVAQAEALDGILKDLGTSLDLCITLSVDEEAVVERLLKRANIEGRLDDNETTIRERLRVHHESTEPLVQFYRDRGMLKTVDGMGTEEKVTLRVAEALES